MDRTYAGCTDKKNPQKFNIYFELSSMKGYGKGF